jgi:hypothetical protein
MKTNHLFTYARSALSFAAMGILVASCGPEAQQNTQQGVLSPTNQQASNGTAPSQQVLGNYTSSLRLRLNVSGGQIQDVDTNASISLSGGGNASSATVRFSADQSLPGLQFNSTMTYIGERQAGGSDRFYSMLSAPLPNFRQLFSTYGSVVDHPFAQTVCLRMEFYFIAQTQNVNYNNQQYNNQQYNNGQYNNNQYNNNQYGNQYGNPQQYNNGQYNQYNNGQYYANGQYNAQYNAQYNGQYNNQQYGNQQYANNQQYAQATWQLDPARSTAYLVRCLAGGGNNGSTPEKGSLLGTQDKAIFSPLNKY